MDRKRANRKLLWGLLIMTAASFAFGWALVPLCDVFCGGPASGNAGAKAGPAVAKEAVDPNREVTIEFVASPASVGSYEFRPRIASMRIHPGKLYETEFYAKNLTSVASVAQAVPSISPTGTSQYFHKTECFSFIPNKLAVGDGPYMPVRFIVNPQLPANIDSIMLAYTFYDTTQSTTPP